MLQEVGNISGHIYQIMKCLLLEAERMQQEQEASACRNLLQNKETNRVPTESKVLPFPQLPMVGQNCAEKSRM
jgi:hypothetical protein